MSVLTKQDLKHLSRLCAIKFTEKDEEKFFNQLDNILKFVSQLKEVNVEGIDPLPHPIESLTLTPRKGIKDFAWKEKLFQNVSHPIKDNMIVIRSAIKW